MEITVNDWLQAADHEVELRRWRDQSGGKTKHVVVEHSFTGISPEMVFWYLTNFDHASYLMWHPAHIGLQWENKVAGPGAIHIAWEKVLGKLAAYRIRLDTPDASPVPQGTSIAVMLNIINTEGDTLIHILNEVEQAGDQTKITCSFVFPEAAPDEFVEAHRRHNSKSAGDGGKGGPLPGPEDLRLFDRAREAGRLRPDSAGVALVGMEEFKRLPRFGRPPRVLCRGTVFIYVPGFSGGSASGSKGAVLFQGWKPTTSCPPVQAPL